MRLALALILLGCSPSRRVAPLTEAARGGRMPTSWYAGGATCSATPAFQVHQYSSGFFILRQPACTNYEKPFLYLIIGSRRALLLDTGAGGIDVAGVVDTLLGAWRRTHNNSPVSLIVAHSHGHGDHVAGDSQFRGNANVTLVERDSVSTRAFFGFSTWPDPAVSIDLGERVLDVIGIPGHQPASLAYYDRTTGVLLSGDSFYPGRLYVNDTAAFVRSIARLVAFTATRPTTAILGTHIEQTAEPFTDYPVGTKDQPNEHHLELTRADLLVLDSTLRGMRGQLTRTRLAHFTIWPQPPSAPPPASASAVGPAIVRSPATRH